MFFIVFYSDSDLLELYVPLIYACIKIHTANSVGTEALENQLDSLRKQGINSESTKSLVIALNEVEAKLQ